MTSRIASVLLFVAVAVVLGVLVPRLRYGRLLLRIGEAPSGRWLSLPAVTALVFVVLSLIEARFWWAAPAGILLFLVALRFAPPPPGSWALHEKGMLCAEGPKPEFVRWPDLERFEWNGNIVTVHRSPILLAGASGSYALEVPPDRRAELEAILATRMRQGS